MRFRLSELSLVAALSAAAVTTAWAGPALDDNTHPGGGTATEPSAAPGATPDDQKVEYGFDIRLRSVHVPKSILELFLDRAAGGASNTGIGVDLVRRRGTVELQLGFEFEHLTVGEGVWINKGDNVAAGDEADYVLSPDNAPGNSSLGWFTVEFTFLNHAVINKYVSVRYGGGAGLGILTGDLYHYDVICNGATNSNPDPGCKPGAGFDTTKFGGAGTPGDNGSGRARAYDLPPVFPVINAIIGVQFKPTDKSVINLEGGIRTAPFIGLSAGYFL